VRRACIGVKGFCLVAWESNTELVMEMGRYRGLGRKMLDLALLVLSLR
jgi:hypothetical protein